MPNTLDGDGLATATTDEQTTQIEADLQAVFGSDVDLSSNSPDGQMIGIYVQSSQDILDLLVSIYNMFSVDSAVGISLHRLVALNGLTLRPGVYTTTSVSVTSDRAQTLPGLDQTAAVAFSVRDSNNVWTLVSSYAFATAGVQALVFQCDEMGAITPIANTITQQNTPTLGITDVNNPTTAGSVVGQLEETDSELRVRHAKMFKLAATGPADAVEAALLDLEDVSDALVVENDTNAPVGSVPVHSIWPIVVGSATDAVIAAAIYAKKSAGCGLFGSESAVVTKPNGQSATMYWDVGIAQRLYVQFGMVSSVQGITFDDALIAQELAAAMLTFWKLNQLATIGDIVVAMQAIESRAILVSLGVSTDGMAYTDTVGTTDQQYYFTLAAADIDIT